MFMSCNKKVHKGCFGPPRNNSSSNNSNSRSDYVQKKINIKHTYDNKNIDTVSVSIYNYELRNPNQFFVNKYFNALLQPKALKMIVFEKNNFISDTLFNYEIIANQLNEIDVFLTPDKKGVKLIQTN